MLRRRVTGVGTDWTHARQPVGSERDHQLEGIRILGKGRRDRELPLWKETKAVLNEWLDVRPPVNNRYLFLTVAGLRDRAMLHLCYAAGLRVSELTGLTLDSLSGPQLARGRAMSPDGFAYILSQHVATAMLAVPSLKTKRVTPHVIRHSTAMTILHATGDIRKVSLWLGHADLKTTEGYLRASPAEKLEILVANAPPSIRPGAFPGAKDSLMSLLGGK